MSKPLTFITTKIRQIESTSFYYKRTGAHALALLDLYTLLGKLGISYGRNVEIGQRCLGITTLRSNDEFVICTVELERVG